MIKISQFSTIFFILGDFCGEILILGEVSFSKSRGEFLKACIEFLKLEPRTKIFKFRQSNQSQLVLLFMTALICFSRYITTKLR